MTGNQATLTNTKQPRQQGASCENEIHLSESIRIIQAWFVRKSHNPFLTLHGHVHHTDSREFKYVTFLSCAQQVRFPSHSYMKEEAKLMDKMPLERERREGGVSRGITLIVVGLPGRSEIETKQRGFFWNKQMSCSFIVASIYSFLLKPFIWRNEVEGQTFKVVRERWRLAISYKPQQDAIPLKSVVIVFQVFSSGVEPCCIFKAVCYCAPEELERVINSAKHCFLCRQQKLISSCAVIGNTILWHWHLFLGNMLSTLVSSFAYTFQEG